MVVNSTLAITFRANIFSIEDSFHSSDQFLQRKGFELNSNPFPYRLISLSYLWFEYDDIRESCGSNRSGKGF